MSEMDDYRSVNISRLGKGKFKEDRLRPTPGSTFSPNANRPNDIRGLFVGADPNYQNI